MFVDVCGGLWMFLDVLWHRKNKSLSPSTLVLFNNFTFSFPWNLPLQPASEAFVISPLRQLPHSHHRRRHKGTRIETHKRHSTIQSSNQSLSQPMHQPMHQSMHQ